MVRPPIHPGEVLADELAERATSAAALARTPHVPTNRSTEIINGRRGITADTAHRLGQWLGTGPAFWLNLQQAYELRKAEQAVGPEIKRTVVARHAASESGAAAR